MIDWERQSSSYRRGWVAGEQGEYDFAQLAANAPNQAEAMQGWADGCRWRVRNVARSESDERERFESWRRYWGDDERDLRRDANNGEYVKSDRERLWQAWQAALTLGSKHGNTSDQVQQG